ncbi:hypothetical protein CAH17_005384, partial [Salmonella enterica subsp. enterica serovar Heidelberg str. CFSAN000576]|nr:hypothetical protein [Salmonella enterica subsp. enterica serovar Heidelberg str. CFSAN000576]
MAVENKFKLNVIAASVLMGLSLSAVAADMPVTSKTESSTTSPAATLADKAGKADISKINVTVGKESKALSSVLSDTLGGSYVPKEGTDNSKKKAYDDAVTKMSEAQGKFDRLTEDKKGQIKTYEASKTTLSNAQSGLNDFVIKANGVNNVYNEKLKALYGTTQGEFVISEDSKTITANKEENSAFSKYSESVTRSNSGLVDTLKAL